MKNIDLIYIDTSFIILSYEQHKEKRMPIRVTKSNDYSGGLGAMGFVSLGASMKEQKEFSMDTNAMFEELRDKFEEYPEINLLQKANNELPELFWLDGIFGLSRSTLQQGDKEIASAHYYQFVQSIETNNRFLNLVTNDVYFSFGYDQLHKYGPALTCDFAIQSRLLVRLLYYDKYYPVAAPLVIFKKGYVP